MPKPKTTRQSSQRNPPVRGQLNHRDFINNIHAETARHLKEALNTLEGATHQDKLSLIQKAHELSDVRVEDNSLNQNSDHRYNQPKPRTAAYRDAIFLSWVDILVEALGGQEVQDS